MDDFMNFIEKWLKRAVLIQLFFLLVAQILLQFDEMVPYLSKAARSEGVIHFLKPAAQSVFALLSGSAPYDL